MPTAETLARVQTLAPVAGEKGQALFSKGFPSAICGLPAGRHSAPRGHGGARPTIRCNSHLKRGRHWFELTLVTSDRPFLFANLAGSLAAWGMNIVKADAFSNQAGMVVDTFFFTDRFRTLELNLPEWGRFKRSVSDVLNGEADLERMLHDRSRSEKIGQSEGRDSG